MTMTNEKPASSLAGGDGVREALESVRAFIEKLVGLVGDADYAYEEKGELDALTHFGQMVGEWRFDGTFASHLDEIAAALAPSTSAATRGDAGFKAGLDAAAEYLLACDDYGDRHKAGEIRKLAPPAPAVESAQVKEAGWWDKPAPPLPRDAEAAYPIVRDAVLASGDPSPRFVQQRFAIGFNRASGFIERMEAEGFITAWQADIQGRRIRASLDLATDAEG